MSSEFTTNEVSVARGKEKIVCTEFIPVTAGKHPAVIMSHGFNSCAAEVCDVAKTLAANGVYALCYDFCGGGNKGKSTGKTTEMSVLTEQDDLRAVIAYVQGREDADKLYLYGESQGGFVSALTAPEYSGLSGLFLVYPAFVIPHDWLGKKEEEISGEFDFMGVKLTRAYFDGVPRYDVVAKAAEFQNSVKIWHGGADPVVDPSYSLELVKTYKNCELTVFSGLGHWFPPELRQRVAAEMISAIGM
ncbi:MAG: alpha/beta hydrolase [Ruminococcus sp.]|nr:alpha/beta hydrolase [Ruminococcus sp.]